MKKKRVDVAEFPPSSPSSTSMSRDVDTYDTHKKTLISHRFSRALRIRGYTNCLKSGSHSLKWYLPLSFLFFSSCIFRGLKNRNASTKFKISDFEINKLNKKFAIYLHPRLRPSLNLRPIVIRKIIETLPISTISRTYGLKKVCDFWHHSTI